MLPLIPGSRHVQLQCGIAAQCQASKRWTHRLPGACQCADLFPQRKKFGIPLAQVLHAVQHGTPRKRVAGLQLQQPAKARQRGAVVPAVAQSMAEVVPVSGHAGRQAASLFKTGNGVARAPQRAQDHAAIAVCRGQGWLQRDRPLGMHQCPLPLPERVQTASQVAVYFGPLRTQR